MGERCPAHEVVLLLPVHTRRLRGLLHQVIEVVLMYFSVEDVLADIAKSGEIPMPNQPAHYSKREDYSRSTAPLYYRSEPNPLIHDNLSSREIAALPPFTADLTDATRSRNSRWLSHRMLPPPPSRVAAECATQSSLATLAKAKAKSKEMKATFMRSQIEQSPLLTLPKPRSQNLVQGSNESLANLTLMSMEIFCCSRGDLLPNPAYDQIAAVFLCFQNASVEALLPTPAAHTVVVINSASLSIKEDNSPDAIVKSLGLTNGEHVELLPSEAALIESVIAFIQRYDPDFILGFEVNSLLSGCLRMLTV